MAGRTLISRFPSFLLSSRSATAGDLVLRRASPLLRRGSRPLFSLAEFHSGLFSGALRCLSTRATTSSLNDPSPNWSNRPPKETILLDGCDFEHWLVVMEPPDPNLTRDEIIDSYIKTLAEVVGSEDEARMKIYSVSTKHYFAFGALVSEELSYKIKALPKVRWVLPDSYLDVRNKDYGGEPFIDGQAVPYDPKYHEEWVRNNARANERSRRNDRPRNSDRSRNFERRRENMQTFQNRDAPPMPNQPPRDMPPMPGSNAQNSMPPRDMPPMPSGNPQNAMPPRDMPPFPNRDVNAMPPTPNRDFNAMPPRDMPPVPNRDFNTMPPRDMPPVPNRDFNTMPPVPNRDFNATPNNQSGYAPNRNPGTFYQGSGQGYQGGGLQGGQGYQGGSGGGQGYQPGPGYQGGGPAHQGGGPSYQGGGPGYQSSPAYQGGSPGYQGGNLGYQQGGGPSYQGGGGGGPRYQGAADGPNYQGGGGGGPSYQGAADGPNYQGGGGGVPPYQGGGRDVPGRD